MLLSFPLLLYPLLHWAYNWCPKMFAKNILKMPGNNTFLNYWIAFLFGCFFFCSSWNKVEIACRLYPKSCITHKAVHASNSSYPTNLISDDFSFHLRAFLVSILCLLWALAYVVFSVWNILFPFYVLMWISMLVLKVTEIIFNKL